MSADRARPMPTVQILATADAAAREAAETLARWIRRDKTERAVVHVALAGGSTPRQAYRELAGMIDDWSGVHLWLGDDRYVPPDAPEANIAMVRAALATPSGIAEAQIHPVPIDADVAGSARHYGEMIAAALPAAPGGAPMFDIVVLGMGEDGHVASLFPESEALVTRDGVCVAVSDAPKPPAERVSLTLGVINAARRRLILTTGDVKADALANGLAAIDPRFPVSLVRDQHTTVIADRAAAALIDAD